MAQNYLNEFNKYQLQKDVDTIRTPNTYLDYFKNKDIPLPVINNTIEGISQRVGEEMKTPYESDQFTASGLTTTPTKIKPSIDTAPITAAPTSAPTNILQNYTPQTEYEKYWGQKVGPGEFKVPLNVLVGAAGKTAYALDPKGFGGILGKQLADDADVATKEMARREYEGPNRALELRIREQQAQKTEREGLAQKDISDFMSTVWPQEEVRLKQMAKTRDEIDEAFVEMLSTVYAKHNPEAAAALREKALEARRSGALRDLITDLRVEQSKLENARKLQELASREAYQKEKIELERQKIGIARSKEDREARKPSGTMKKVFDPATGQYIWRTVQEGDVAGTSVSRRDITKAKTALDNPEKVKIEDLSAFADDVNFGSTETFAYMPHTSYYKALGVKVPWTSSQIYKKVPLPIITINGVRKQLTTQDIRDTMASSGASFNDVVFKLMKKYPVEGGK